MPEATKMDPVLSPDTDVARKMSKYKQHIDNLTFLTDEEKEKLAERMAYEFSIAGLNNMLEKLERDAYGKKAKGEKYAPKDLEVIQIFRKIAEETEKSVILTSEAIMKLQEEKEKKPSITAGIVRDAFKELVVKKGWGNAAELTKELKAIEDSYVKAKKPTVQRAQVHFDPITPESFEKVLSKALGESKQMKEGRFTDWLSKIWSWVRSVFGKRLRTTQQINKETQALLNKMNQSNWAYETKLYIRESLNIKGM